MTMTEADVALAEYQALREEILAVQARIGNHIATALTLLAAVGAFALSKKEGRIEVLLVLPVVLSGLGILVVDGVRSLHRLGSYIRKDLWNRLPHGSGIASWEHYMYATRPTRRGTLEMALGVVPILLIFIAPGVASLAIAVDAISTKLAPLWISGALALASFLAVSVVLLRDPPSPETEPTDQPGRD